MGLRAAILDPGNYAPYNCNQLCAALAARLDYVALVTSPYAWDNFQFAGNYDLRFHFYRLGSRVRPPGLRRLVKALEHPWDWLRLLLWARRARINVVHLQWAVLPPIDYCAVLALKRMGITVLFTAHDLRPFFRIPGAAYFLGRIYRAADHVLAYAEFSAAQLARAFQVQAGNITVLPPGHLFDKETHCLSKAAARQALGLEPGGLVLLMFGGIQPYKGLEVLLEAFGRLHALAPDARLIIAGRPRYRLPAAVETQAGIVACLKYVPEPDTPVYYLCADLVVLPYLSADTSAVLLSALALGRPVVVTEVGALGQIVRAAGAGLVVPPADPQALFAALHSLATDRPRLAQLEAQAARWRDGTPTWGQVADRTIALYEAALARP